MATLQLLRQEPTGVVYADPAKPDMTVRFRNNTTPKTLNSVGTKNYLTEIIYNDGNNVTIGGIAAVDAISVRLRVSGTAESAARLAVILHSLAQQIDAWTTQKVFSGFPPTSAPVIPAAA